MSEGTMSWDMKKVSSFDFISDITHCGDRIVDSAIGECTACIGSMRKAYRLLVEKNRRVVKKSERQVVY